MKTALLTFLSRDTAIGPFIPLTLDTGSYLTLEEASSLPPEKTRNSVDHHGTPFLRGSE